MGMGKTISVLTAINILMYKMLEINRVLIIAPKKVASKVWSDEIHGDGRKIWSHIKHLKISKIIGNQRQREAALRANADIYMIGRDNVAWLCNLYGGGYTPFDMLVIDESSSFKNHNSVKFKSLKKIQPLFERVVILTGTPSPNGLIDLWSQIWLLDRGERLGKTIGEYRRKYFSPGMASGHIVYNYKIRKGSEELIHDQIKDICVSMRSIDHLDPEVPEMNPIYLSMDSELKAKYEAFEKEKVLEMLTDENGELSEISAVNAAALSTKLLQFCNGAIYDEHRNVHEIHDLKLEAAEEIVETANGNPILIAWAYQHDRDRLMERLKKYKPKELKTDKDIDDWNNGKIQVLLMHPASGGHGLNLQYGGNIILWFGHTFSLELFQQLNKRLDRPGKKGRVTIHQLILENSRDADVLEALSYKTGTQDHLMESLKARIKKYVQT